MNDLFHKFSSATANAVGSSWAFIMAIAIVLIWGLTGPIFGFSNTWQLVINTGTTIVTFLMVFLIQNMQNRDAKAVHLKLDELLRGVRGARTGLVDLEDLSDEELNKLQKQFIALRARAGGDNGHSKANTVAANTITAGTIKADRNKTSDIEDDPANGG